MIRTLWPDLSQRSAEAELMDDPATDPVRLARTLDQFALLNRLFTRSRLLLRRYLLADMRRDPTRTYSVLDLGGGGGDLALWFCAECRRQGLRVRWLLLDHDPRVAAYAREHCRPDPAIEVHEGSALDLADLPAADYLFANHLLHHLTFTQIAGLLDQAVLTARRRFLFNDLRRSAWALAGYSAFTRLFLRDSFAYEDGRRSIARGFTPAELRAVVRASRWADRITVRAVWPARLVLVGRPHADPSA